jgi:hypothetical protein
MGILLSIPIRFETFVPLQAFVDRGVFPIVGNLEVPESMRALPIFRAGFVDPKTKKFRIGGFGTEKRSGGSALSVLSRKNFLFVGFGTIFGHQDRGRMVGGD